MFWGTTNFTDWFNAAKVNDFKTTYEDFFMKKKSNTRLLVAFKSGKNSW